MISLVLVFSGELPFTACSMRVPHVRKFTFRRGPMGLPWDGRVITAAIKLMRHHYNREKGGRFVRVPPPSHVTLRTVLRAGMPSSLQYDTSILGNLQSCSRLWLANTSECRLRKKFRKKQW